MFAGLRKNIQTSYLFYILSLLVVLLFFLSSGHDLLHNHEPDLEDHHDCPAFQIYLLFSSAIVYYCAFCFIIGILTFVLLYQYNSVYSIFKYTFNSRAPPFQIFKSVSCNFKWKEISHYQNLKGSNLCLRTIEIGVFPYLSF